MKTNKETFHLSYFSQNYEKISKFDNANYDSFPLLRPLLKKTLGKIGLNELFSYYRTIKKSPYLANLFH